jgi:hypothetical protein
LEDQNHNDPRNKSPGKTFPWSFQQLGTYSSGCRENDANGYDCQKGSYSKKDHLKKGSFKKKAGISVVKQASRRILFFMSANGHQAFLNA